MHTQPRPRRALALLAAGTVLLVWILLALANRSDATNEPQSQAVRPGRTLNAVMTPAPHRSPPVVVHRTATLQPAPERRPIVRRATHALHIHVVAAVPISRGQAAVNRCAGPVMITYPGATPQIVQHDFCGGTWVLGLRPGQRVVLSGSAVGTYVVGARRVISLDSNVTSVNGLGDLVAQTCIAGTHSAQLVGLVRVGA